MEADTTNNNIFINTSTQKQNSQRKFKNKMPKKANTNILQLIYIFKKRKRRNVVCMLC